MVTPVSRTRRSEPRLLPNPEVNKSIPSDFKVLGGPAGLPCKEVRVSTEETVATPPAVVGGTTLTTPPYPAPPASSVIQRFPEPSATGPPTGVFSPSEVAVNEWIVSNVPTVPFE